MHFCLYLLDWHNNLVRIPSDPNSFDSEKEKLDKKHFNIFCQLEDPWE